MLTDLLTRLGRWSRPRLAVPPWSSSLGLARTLLALGTLATLLATDPAVLLSPLANGAVPPLCSGPAGWGVWCLAPEQPQLGRWLSILVLVAVASGWRPRLTAVPHWYVSWSLTVNATILDGGDQVTAVLTLLLVPIGLTDPRRWHWQRRPATPAAEIGNGQLAGWTAALLIQIQVAVIYLHAAIAKLGVPEWADGTSLFYWFRHPVFGAPSWLRPATELVTGSPFGVAAITWGTLVLEFSLGIALLLPVPARRLLLVSGLAFHGMIAVAMGLISFGLAMSAALLLYLLPTGHELVWPGRLRDRLRSVGFATIGARHNRATTPG
jgi:antimicrobial peptide system SdpB family protein